MNARLRVQCFSLSVLFISAARGSAAADQSGVSFSYDPAGRLVTGFYNQLRCLVYGYDPAGNRTSQVLVTKAAAPPVWGVAQWNGFSWTSGMLNPVWGVGNWGCLNWTSN